MRCTVKDVVFNRNLETWCIRSACNELGVKVEFIRAGYGFTVGSHRHCGDGWSTNS